MSHACMHAQETHTSITWIIVSIGSTRALVDLIEIESANCRSKQSLSFLCLYMKDIDKFVMERK